MYVVESTIVINRPIEDVFAFVTDSENDPKWAIPVTECTRITDETASLGTKYTYSSPMGPFVMQGKMEIVVYEPSTHIEWDGETMLMKWRGRCSFEQKENGTQVTMKTDFHGKGIVKFLESMMQSPFKKSYDEQFQNLKKILDS